MNRPTSRDNRFIRPRMRIAGKIAKWLRENLGRNLLAVGATGSVARGTAEKYSDIDLLVITRKLPPALPRFRIIDGTYCSIGYETWNTAFHQLTTPHRQLPELLGGFTKIVPIFDPKGILSKLESRARSIPASLFRRSAELALLQSYEDFCRAKNAYLNGDDIVLKDNVYHVTHSAAVVIAALNQTAFVSDREIFKAYKTYPNLPKGFSRIEQLRYGNLKRPQSFKMLLSFYVDLVHFCDKESVRFPVDEKTLKELDP